MVGRDSMSVPESQSEAVATDLTGQLLFAESAYPSDVDASVLHRQHETMLPPGPVEQPQGIGVAAG